MTTYDEMKTKVCQLLSENNMSAYDFVRIAKDLCTCATCKYFIQHYDNNGKWVAFGHCIHGNSPKARQPYQSCCGGWDIDGKNGGAE